jgi:hypothetical protein
MSERTSNQQPRGAHPQMRYQLWTSTLPHNNDDGATEATSTLSEPVTASNDSEPETETVTALY